MWAMDEATWLAYRKALKSCDNKKRPSDGRPFLVLVEAAGIEFIFQLIDFYKYSNI